MEHYVNKSEDPVHGLFCSKHVELVSHRCVILYKHREQINIFFKKSYSNALRPSQGFACSFAYLKFGMFSCSHKIRNIQCFLMFPAPHTCLHDFPQNLAQNFPLFLYYTCKCISSVSTSPLEALCNQTA